MRVDTFIRRVDHPADLGRERQERDHVLPGVAPGLVITGGSCAPHFSLEGLERLEGVVGVDRGVDRLQVLDHGVVLRGAARI